MVDVLTILGGVDVREYFLRRLLLIVPTMIGITMACFLLMHFVPGGPVEQALMRMRAANQQESGAGGANYQANMTQAELENIKKIYGFDQPVHIRYLRWLSKVVRLDLGTSYTYERPVLDLVVSRFPVSLTFGLFGLFATYLVCIPLGIKKALTHRETFDNLSSILVFMAYSIPSFALGVLFIVVLGGQLNLFPIAGMVSDGFEELSFLGKIGDYMHHMFLPLVCYTIGSFATLTLLMKNSLMEVLGQDYFRTALAKGLSYKQALFDHALRNALIPIATNIGAILSVIFAGSFLIETVFSIDGMGLLGYEAIVNRDYPVALGIIFLSSLIMLVGRILSDICLVLVDPRIRFE